MPDFTDRQAEFLEALPASSETLADELDISRSGVFDLKSRTNKAGADIVHDDEAGVYRRADCDTDDQTLSVTTDVSGTNDTVSIEDGNTVELDDDYDLAVVQKNGERLAPDQLSGGERALFNLSLRCAIYRLLAEGIDGAAPMPPLILDEPTVFLDSGHVSRLVDLVEEMRNLGVAQTVIVSHDEELVGAADALVTVEKDPTTNRSTVRRDPIEAEESIVGTNTSD